MTPAALQGARAELGLSMEKLAFTLGVSTSTIRNWEHGAHRIPHAARLAVERMLADQRAAERKASR